MLNSSYVPLAAVIAPPPPDTSTSPRYPVPPDVGNPLQQLEPKSPLHLSDPPNIQREVVYDPITGKYIFKSRVGDFTYRTPTPMTAGEYMNFQNKKGIQNYWQERSQQRTSTATGSVIPQIYVGGKVFDQIFGSNTIDIRPQGSAEVTFGVRSMLREDPQLNVRQRRTTNW